MDSLLKIIFLIAIISSSFADMDYYGTGDDDCDTCEGTCVNEVGSTGSNTCYPDVTEGWCSVSSSSCWTSYCTYGHETDSYGCNTCSCLSYYDYPSHCSKKIDCYNTCQFGRAFNSKGCRTCECLPDGCKGAVCPQSDQICGYGVSEYCQDCPRCIDERYFGYVQVSMTYTYYSYYSSLDLSSDLFGKKVQTSISSLMSSGNNVSVLNVQAGIDSSVSVTLLISVYNGEPSNVYRALYNIIQSPWFYTTTVYYDGLTFTPDASSMSVQYKVAPFTRPPSYEIGDRVQTTDDSCPGLQPQSIRIGGELQPLHIRIGGEIKSPTIHIIRGNIRNTSTVKLK